LQTLNMNAEEIKLAITQAYEPIESPDLTSVGIGDDYGQFAEGPVGIRPSHARAALAAPAAIQAFRGDQTQHVLVTCRVDAHRPFIQLFELHVRGDTLALCAAWRVYGTDGSPVDLFAWLVERYGALVTVGGLATANFVARLTVPQFEGSPSQLLQPQTPQPGSENYTVCTMRVEGGNISIEWAYAFDLGAYRTETLKAARTG
jgi:hypothetical protein